MLKYDIKELRIELSEASKINEYPLRHIKIVLVISKALSDLKIEPILVGGGAVEFYTMGGYTTVDIDLIAPSGKNIDIRLTGLGFDKRGKNYVNDDLDIFLEFPSSSLSEGADYNELDIEDGKIRIISIEDLIVDRLNAFKWWNSTIDGVSSLLLLNSKVIKVDHALLEVKVKGDDLVNAYEYILKIWREIEDGALDIEAASERIGEFER